MISEKELNELYKLERAMISAKYDGKKIKYWYLKRKYKKMKKRLEGK